MPQSPPTFRSPLVAAAALLALIAGFAFVGRTSRGPAAPPRASTPAAVAARPSGPPPTLVILHTNDWHGYALASTNLRTGEREGGVAAAAGRIAQLRKEYAGRVLLLDGGDLLSGHPAASFVEDGVKGLTFARLWDALGYDAWAIGNHECDHGRENLQALCQKLTSPALCANWLETPEDGRDADPMFDACAVPAAPWRVVERNGLRVGIVGLVTAGLPTLASEATLAGTTVLHPIKALKKVWDELDANTDLQIALTHIGVDGEKRLAAAFPGLDAVVGGHSHTYLWSPEDVGGRPVCQAGQHGRRLGQLKLWVEDGEVTRYEGELLPLPASLEAEAPPALREAVAALTVRVEALENEVLGTATRSFGRSYHYQSELGGAVAEAYRIALGADVGFVNAGGVRADLDEGPVTRKELMEIQPFDNRLVRFELTGEQLLAVLQYNAQCSADEAHGILQVAGVTSIWARTADGHADLIETKVGDAPIDPAKRYVIAASDYLISQAEKYLGMKTPEHEQLEGVVRDALEALIRSGALNKEHPGVHHEFGKPATESRGRG